jgi:hypothetical protein
MSNIFEEVLTDVKAVEEKYLGKDYPYYKYIKMPSQMGMSSKGTLSALATDIDGLVGYVSLLVSGDSKASATGKPLGNKFFLNTGAKCTDVKTKQDVDRYIYINNVPVGNIPLISSGMGVNFSEFKGLIPGTMSALNVINPFAILQSFLSGPKPQCQEVTMETIDIYNNKSTESHFVSLIDLQNMDPCIFMNKTNPFSDPVKHCVEAFTERKKNRVDKVFKVPDDVIAQGYFASLGVLGIFILYNIMTKMK